MDNQSKQALGRILLAAAFLGAVFCVSPCALAQSPEIQQRLVEVKESSSEQASPRSLHQGSRICLAINELSETQ
jgi:hypothetical protein